MPIPVVACSRDVCAAVALSALLAVFGTAAHATIYLVTANSDMTFTPAALTVYQGDSVRFTNTGGLHNVHADDNRFICAQDCTTHGAPSSALWSVLIRFDRLGDVGYYCDQHGNLTSGMRGTTTVIDRVFVDGFDGPPTNTPRDGE
ncbi:MAG: plastocyanin/azurin family copper-binding protein [Dokdonella sp.]